jgi:hypothetical protein
MASRFLKIYGVEFFFPMIQIQIKMLAKIQVPALGPIAIFVPTTSVVTHLIQVVPTMAFVDHSLTASIFQDFLDFFNQNQIYEKVAKKSCLQA